MSEPASVSGREGGSHANAVSWTCCANLSTESSLQVLSPQGVTILSCCFDECKLVSHTSDYYSAVAGRPRPPPERWRAALELGRSSVILHGTNPEGGAAVSEHRVLSVSQLQLGLGGAIKLLAEPQGTLLTCEHMHVGLRTKFASLVNAMPSARNALQNCCYNLRSWQSWQSDSIPFSLQVKLR